MTNYPHLANAPITEAILDIRVNGATGDALAATQVFAEAVKAEPNDPNAMALATVDADGLPNVRMVLLKGFDQRGFVFYSNDGSLRLQSQSFFDGSLVTWRCQINGDTMSVIEQTGAAHVYTRAN